MDQKRLKAQLIELAEQGKPRESKMQRFRDVYPQIEYALRNGRGRQEILKLLNSDGYEMSMASFKSYLQRVRQEARGAQMDAGNGMPDASGDNLGGASKHSEANRQPKIGVLHVSRTSADPSASSDSVGESAHRPSIADFLPPRSRPSD